MSLLYVCIFHHLEIHLCERNQSVKAVLSFTLMDVLLSSMSVSVSSRCPSSATFWSTIPKVPTSLQANTNRRPVVKKKNQWDQYTALHQYTLLSICLHLGVYGLYYKSSAWIFKFSCIKKKNHLFTTTIRSGTAVGRWWWVCCLQLTTGCHYSKPLTHTHDTLIDFT